MKKGKPALTLISMFCFLILCACTGGTVDSSVEEVPSPQELTWREQYDLGVRYLSEGNYEEAILAFTVAIKIDPKQAPAYVGRGNAYVKSGETEENLTAAKADYEKAIELDETNAEAYLGLADVYTLQGDIEATRTILEQGLAVTGDARLQARLDELDEIERQESLPEGASETVTAVGWIIDNSDEYWDQWFPYVEQYRSACVIPLHGIRFDGAINAQFDGNALFIQEAEVIGPWTYQSDKVLIGQRDEEIEVGQRMELTGYFLPREESGELTGPEYDETVGKDFYTYHPNGDYYFYVESYTLLD